MLSYNETISVFDAKETKVQGHRKLKLEYFKIVFHKETKLEIIQMSTGNLLKYIEKIYIYPYSKLVCGH